MVWVNGSIYQYVFIASIIILRNPDVPKGKIHRKWAWGVGRGNQTLCSWFLWLGSRPIRGKCGQGGTGDCALASI